MQPVHTKNKQQQLPIKLINSQNKQQEQWLKS